jgi:recombinational DNA repair protein RecR
MQIADTKAAFHEKSNVVGAKKKANTKLETKKEFQRHYYIFSSRLMTAAGFHLTRTFNRSVSLALTHNNRREIIS